MSILGVESGAPHRDAIANFNPGGPQGGPGQGRVGLSDGPGQVVVVGSAPCPPCPPCPPCAPTTHGPKFITRRDFRASGCGDAPGGRNVALLDRPHIAPSNIVGPPGGCSYPLVPGGESSLQTRKHRGLGGDSGGCEAPRRESVLNDERFLGPNQPSVRPQLLVLVPARCVLKCVLKTLRACLSSGGEGAPSAWALYSALGSCAPAVESDSAVVLGEGVTTRFCCCSPVALLSWSCCSNAHSRDSARRNG